MSLLYTHSRELNASLSELKEPSSNTDWILFGYEGDDLTLINSGSNGLEEIKDEFDEECVQYALLKIFDETSKMLRYIYIAWCGEYAPPFQKANFSQHSQIVERFFNGYHVKINARCYEDVEPENIIGKVQNSSFTNFSTRVAPVPFKKPIINLPGKSSNPLVKNIPTPNELKNMKPTQSFRLGIKKPENNETVTPTPTVKPDPTPVKIAPPPAPGPRPNPLSPRPQRANPLSPRSNPLAPKAKPAAPAPAPVVSAKPVIPSKPTPTATSTVTPTPISSVSSSATSSTTSLNSNPLNPRRANPLAPKANPLSPSRSNPASPKQNPVSPRPNPLNRNAPFTEPVQSTRTFNPVGPPRVSMNTGVFDKVKIEPASEPAVENDGIDTSSRDSVANVRKMFEKKPEKKMNKIALKSAFFSNQGNNEYKSKAKVREERLRREQEDNALLEREKLANKQRELQEEISESRKSNETVNTVKPEPVNQFKSNPLNSPKSTPITLSSTNPFVRNNPLNPPKTNPLNANRANPLSPPKSNPLNANRANPLSPPKSNPLNANRANPLSPPKSNPLNDAPALPARENPLAPPALPARENPLNPPALPARENPLAPPPLPARENPLAPPALPARNNPLAPPALPARENPLAPPPLPQRVIDSSSEKREREERERKEREERERKEREERERREREERERKEREERERREREERERKEREEREKMKAAATSNGSGSGETAVVTFDYEPQEENEIALVEGEVITNIIQLDEGWWQGENSKGEVGLFPSNYVELIPSAAPAAPAVEAKPSAIALYDYEAQEENEISFKEGDIITNLNFVTDDWWEGVVDGKCGLFPGNYVEVNK